MTGLVEFSASFDTELVEPFLHRLADIIEGFDAAKLERVRVQLIKLDTEEEVTLDLPVLNDGREQSLRIHIFKDDEAVYDLYFFAKTDLAAKIQAAAEAFFASHGL